MNTPCVRLARVGAQHAQAADEHGHLGRAQGQQLRLVHQHFLGRHRECLLLVVAETVGFRLQHGERFHVGLVLRGVNAARGEGHLHRVTGSLGRRFNRCAASQHDEVRQGDLLAAFLGAVEGPLDGFEHAQHLGQLRRLVDFPVLLRRQANASAVGAAAVVRAAEGGGRGPSSGDQLRHRQARVQNLGLELGNVPGVDQGVGDGRERILPDQVFGRDFRAEVSDLGTHVAVGQFEPGAGESVSKGLRVLVEAARNGLVDRVEAQRQVGCGHHGPVLLRRVMGVGDHVFRLHVLGMPLPGAGRALGQLPLVAEQHIEIAVVPLRGVGFPCALDAAGGGVHALAGAEPVDPAQPLLFDGGGLGLGANQFRIARAVRLAEGVAAGSRAQRSLRRSCPCGRRSRAHRGPKPRGRGCRWGLRGLHRSGPSARQPAGFSNSRSPL